MVSLSKPKFIQIFKICAPMRSCFTEDHDLTICVGIQYMYPNLITITFCGLCADFMHNSYNAIVTGCLNITLYTNNASY